MQPFNADNAGKFGSVPATGTDLSVRANELLRSGLAKRGHVLVVPGSVSAADDDSDVLAQQICFGVSEFENGSLVAQLDNALLVHSEHAVQASV